MRRILLGGLGIALGAFAPPLLAPQFVSAAPPTRAATFGRPTAVPDTPAPTNSVAPAGLFRGDTVQPVVGYAPVDVGTPVVLAQQPGGLVVPSPMPMPPSSGMPMTPPPMPGTNAPGPASGGPPMVFESRDPTGRIPTGTIVPSVSPEGFVCPEPCLEDPIYGDRPGLGLDRLRGCGRTWVSAEVLMWWNRSAQIPPLVTTSTPAFNGIVGAGDTRVLLGGSFGDTFHVGGRVGGGYWFDDNQCRGLDWRVFWVNPASSTFSASTASYPLLARPFFNVNPGTAPIVGFGSTAEVVGGPGVANGLVTTTLKSTIWGAEADYRRSLYAGPSLRLDALVGYRYLDLSEDLTINESFTRIPGSNFSVGTPAVSGSLTDRFHTQNQFQGGQIGLTGTLQSGRWSLDTRATVAFGTVFQSANISGAQVLTFADGSMHTTPGGLLTAPYANIGNWSQTRFGVVPEIGANLGYQLTPRLKVFVGYNFLYLSSALRPGGVIDTNVDAARVPNLLPAGSVAPVTPIHPVPPMTSSGYFIQGINFGLVFRW